MAVSVPAGSVFTQIAGTAGRGTFQLYPPADRLPGDLLIAVVGSAKQYSSVSTGWTQIASIGSGSAYLAAFWKIAEGNSNDYCTLALASSGSYAVGMLALRAPTGFDATSVESSSHNTATGAGASYALSSGLTGVNTGELSVVLGGNHGTTDYFNNTCGVSGTNWTLVGGGGSGIAGPGGCASGQNATTGSPAVPSITFTDSTHTFGRFVFAAVIKEATASGTPGGGLFWGTH